MQEPDNTATRQVGETPITANDFSTPKPVEDKCEENLEESTEVCQSEPLKSNSDDAKKISMSNVLPERDVPKQEVGKCVGWLDDDEFEIGDHPFDVLTGLRTSSPEDLSSWEQPTFFSISSYRRRARKQKEFARIDSSILSRPLSASTG